MGLLHCGCHDMEGKHSTYILVRPSLDCALRQRVGVRAGDAPQQGDQFWLWLLSPHRLLLLSSAKNGVVVVSIVCKMLPLWLQKMAERIKPQTCPACTRIFWLQFGTLCMKWEDEQSCYHYDQHQ